MVTYTKKALIALSLIGSVACYASLISSENNDAIKDKNMKRLADSMLAIRKAFKKTESSAYFFDTAYVELTRDGFYYHDRYLIRSGAPKIDATEAIRLIIIPSLQQLKIDTPAYIPIYGYRSNIISYVSGLHEPIIDKHKMIPDYIYMTHTEWNSFIDQLCDLFNTISGFIQNKIDSQILKDSFASIENTIQSCLYNNLSTFHKISFFLLGESKHELSNDPRGATMENLYCRLREIKALLGIGWRISL